MNYSPEQRAAYKAGVAASRKKKSTRTRKAKPYTRKAYKPRRSAAAAATAPARIGTDTGDVGLTMSDAGKAYLAAITNPSMAPACGMPVTGFPTEKNKCWARGRMATGTNGTGFILGVPSNIAVNDANCAYVTGATFVGTFLDTSGTGITAVKSNSPYSSASYGAALLKSRFVAGEIRIRYIGTELNRGGDAVVYCDTNHNSLVGATAGTEAKLLSYAASGRSFIDMHEWISCKYNGVVDPTEENFVVDPSSSVLTKNASACMAIWINSAVPAQPFDYEVWGHFEVVGSLGAAMTTTTPDPIAHTAVNSAAQSAQITHPGSHEEHEYMTKTLGETAKTIVVGQTKVGDVLDHKGVFNVITNFVKNHKDQIIHGVEVAGKVAGALAVAL